MAKPKKLADQLGQVDTSDFQPALRGPRNACYPLYGAGDMDDWQAVENLRQQTSWQHAQRVVDELLGITEPIDNAAFRYHWRRGCSCWPRETRRR